MRRPSDESKMREGRGQGILENYKPYIKSREFMRSLGTRVTWKCWKYNRRMQFLSHAEFYAALLYLWEDDVTDVREQFPLELEETNRIADELGYRRVHKGESPMTTDFVVTRNGDYTHLEAVWVKAERLDPHDKHYKRQQQKKEIERTYWERRGCTFTEVYKTDLDLTKAKNISYLSPWADPDNIRPGNRFDIIKHLIITKRINVDLSERLDFRREIDRYLPESRSLEESIALIGG